MGLLVSTLFTAGGYIAINSLGLVHTGPSGFILTGIGAVLLVGSAMMGGWVGAKVH